MHAVLTWGMVQGLMSASQCQDCPAGSILPYAPMHSLSTSPVLTQPTSYRKTVLACTKLLRGTDIVYAVNRLLRQLSRRRYRLRPLSRRILRVADNLLPTHTVPRRSELTSAMLLPGPAAGSLRVHCVPLAPTATGVLSHLRCLA
eukprot:2000470-Rhodomonas_salina.1